MPKKDYLKKTLIIGAGPIVIGQAAEFDYAGTQACKAIREEGIQTVLVNSNPATIMTDRQVADKVYMEPLTAGTRIPTAGNIFATIRQSELTDDTAGILKDYLDAGFRLYVSPDNLDFVSANGIKANVMTYDTAISWISNHDEKSDKKLALVMNVPEMANSKENDSFPVRRKAVERGVPTMTCMDTAKAFLKAIKLKQNAVQLEYYELEQK